MNEELSDDEYLKKRRKALWEDPKSFATIGAFRAEEQYKDGVGFGPKIVPEKSPPEASEEKEKEKFPHKTFEKKEKKFANTKKATKGKPPAKKIRVGNVQVQIWENVTKMGQTFATITLERSYKDTFGNFKYTHSCA